MRPVQAFNSLTFPIEVVPYNRPLFGVGLTGQWQGRCLKSVAFRIKTSKGEVQNQATIARLHPWTIFPGTARVSFSFSWTERPSESAESYDKPFRFATGILVSEIHPQTEHSVQKKPSPRPNSFRYPRKGSWRHAKSPSKRSRCLFASSILTLNSWISIEMHVVFLESVELVFSGLIQRAKVGSRHWPNILALDFASPV